MKVIPRNQTLILASERPKAGDRSSTPLDQAFAAASNAGPLQRVTIVATQTDTTLLYLRADYAQTGVHSSEAAHSTATLEQSTDGLPTAGAKPTAVSASRALVAGAVLSSSVSSKSREPGLSAFLSPVEQYARTQSILTPPRSALYIDVLA